MIYISLIDDHSIFRTCLKNYLTKQENISIEIDDEDPSKFLSKLMNSKTDIIVADLLMPKMNGLELIKLLKQKHPQIKIIVLSMSTDLEQISDLIDKGIHGYVSKSDDVDDLINAIYSVYENKIYRNKIFTDALYWHSFKDASKYVNGTKIEFSEREKKVIQLLWEDKSNKEIANELYLSIRTIEKMRQDLKERVSVKTTLGLIKYAIHNKIILDSSRKELLHTKK